MDECGEVWDSGDLGATSEVFSFYVDSLTHGGGGGRNVVLEGDQFDSRKTWYGV